MGIPAELRVDAVYRNTGNWKNPEDVFNRFFRFPDGGINNTAGFRPKKKAGGSSSIKNCAFCILVTTFSKVEWPDRLNYETGQFTYYGDNRSPGTQLHKTSVGGNSFLRYVFELAHSQAWAVVVVPRHY